MINQAQSSWYKRLWPHHFSKQVVLLTFATIVISTITLTAYQISRVNQFQYDNARDRLAAIANNVSLGVTHSLIVKNYADIELLLRRSAIYPGVQSITVVDSKGRPVSSVIHTPPWPPEPVFLSNFLTVPSTKSTTFNWSYGKNEQANPFALGLDATELTIWQPIENASLGWLTINFSVDYIRDDALRLIRNSILFSLATLILLTLLLSRLLQPNLRALVEATSFAEGLYYVHGQQMHTTHVCAEIDSLNRALNEASKKLYAQDEEILGANRLLLNVLDASSEVSIIATNTEGLISVFNNGAERLLGYTADEVINKLTPAPFHLPTEVIARAQELSATLGYPVEGFRTFVEVAEQEGSEQREWTYVRKNGEHVPVSLVVTTMRNETGQISGYLGIAQDITERKRIDQMKSEFVSTVSHELRTPLTAISGALGLIAGGALGEMPDNAKQMINIAHKNSQRLTFLINDLLDMEKLVAGKMHFDMKLQPLMPLIEQSIEDNRTYGSVRHVTLKLTSAAPDIEVSVDSQRLMQVMSNLLSNAIKYSPDDDTVEISVHPQEKTVRITISDNGLGIPADFIDHIFKKFSQADSSDTRQKGGSGLGLAITRELVERMSGKIGFESIENQGASFYFDLPIGDTQTNNLSPAILDATKVTDKLNAPRVLVVEDEPDIAKLITIMLNRAGYSVDIALNGKQALESLAQNRYVAMTLDLMLPDISGLELIQQIRIYPETKELPIVVISAKMEEGRLAINGEFADIDWLAKPIDEAHLLSTVEKYLTDQNKNRPSVLHVEDDYDLHQVIRTMSGERFDFIYASTLREARSHLSKEHFDLIILDISLPDGSGWQLLPEIRMHHPHSRVIILSGANTTPDEARKVEAVLLKSNISTKDLLQTLNNKNKG